MNGERIRRSTLRLAWAGVALAALLVVLTGAPSAEADDPPGDCWNGALSNDPLHCYILEEAQRAGRLEVAAVYLEPGYAPLYIFLKQTAPLSADVGAYLRDKAHEYMIAAERRAVYGVESCEGAAGDERKWCLDELIGRPQWRSFDSILSGGFPPSSKYSMILMDVGGAEARRSRWGWATWRQLWPVETGFATASASAEFDVSEVDVTTFPKPDCDKDVGGAVERSCYRWMKTPESWGLGIAGQHMRIPAFMADTIYLNITSATPEDDTKLEELKQRVFPGYDKPDEYGFGPYKVEIARVKYDFGQLWRWGVILDRFSQSAGNTIGMMGSRIQTNRYNKGNPGWVWLNGASPVVVLEGGFDDWSTVRNVLTVWAQDSSVVAAALPRLLPALGIPSDAVGLVIQVDYRLFAPVNPAPIPAPGGGGLGTSSAAPAPLTVTPNTPDSPQVEPSATEPSPSDASESGPGTPGAAAPSESAAPGLRWAVAAAGAVIVLAAVALAAVLTTRHRP